MGLKVEGPQRLFGRPLGPETDLEVWASEQARLLAEMKISEKAKYIAAMNVAVYGGDPTPIAMILVNRNVTSLSAVYEMLSEGKTIFAPILGDSMRSQFQLTQVVHQVTPGFQLGVGWRDLDFAEITMEPWHPGHADAKAYDGVPIGKLSVPSSFLSCLRRYALSKGGELRIDLVENILFARYKGEPSQRDKLLVGTEFRGHALKLSLL